MNAKKVLVASSAALIVLYAATQPAQAAAAVTSISSWLSDGLATVVAFGRSVLG